MAHFAKVIDGIVSQVIVAGHDYINALVDADQWIQTSYNTHGGVHYGQDGEPDGGVALRANYAGIGDTYDIANDVFYAPQPYPSWTIGAPDWIWHPPTPMPTDGKLYRWDEPTLNWVELI